MNSRTIYRWNPNKNPYDVGKTPQVSRDFVMQVAQAVSEMGAFTFDDIYARFPDKKELRIYHALKCLHDQELTSVVKRGRGKWLNELERAELERRLQNKESIYKVADEMGISLVGVYVHAREGDYIPLVGRSQVLLENFPEYLKFILDRISAISQTADTFSAHDIDPTNSQYAGRFLGQLVGRGQLYSRKKTHRKPAVYSLRPLQVQPQLVPKSTRKKTPQRTEDLEVSPKDTSSILTAEEIEQIKSGRIGGVRLG